MLDNIFLQIQADYADEWMETSFRQLQAESTRGTLHVLVSKKGRITLKDCQKYEKQTAKNPGM